MNKEKKQSTQTLDNPFSQPILLMNNNFAGIMKSGIAIIYHDDDGCNAPLVIKVTSCIWLGNAINKDQSNKSTKSSSDLYVTWVHVPALHLHGVEKYVAEYYRPRIESVLQDVEPIPINLPPHLPTFSMGLPWLEEVAFDYSDSA